MNRGEIRDQVSFFTNFNSGQADADISTTKLNQAIQYAYNAEVSRLQQTTLSWPWIRTTIINWPANQVLCAIPSYVTNTSWTKIRDITDTDNPEGYLFVPLWRDLGNWQWPHQDGPQMNRTYRVTYLSRAEALTADTDVPQLIAPQFHDLIVWSASTFIRKIADEQAPPAFQEELNMWRSLALSFYSRGQPNENAPVIGQGAGHRFNGNEDNSDALAADGSSIVY